MIFLLYMPFFLLSFYTIAANDWTESSPGMEVENIYNILVSLRGLDYYMLNYFQNAISFMSYVKSKLSYIYTLS